jgi:putative membrane protein insertion efficiency factor
MHPGETLKQTTVQPSNASQSSDAGLTAAQHLALACVRSYQVLIRPMLSGQCRYLPTCSEYAAESIARYGALQGGWMGLKRLMRCHPFGGSGLDPVPLDQEHQA